jgi:ubiquinone/menaquinone biosynthesis C-methylase UbiE
MKQAVQRTLTPGTTGAVLHTAVGYDWLVWFFTFGRERIFRDRMLSLARLEPGESVLDVGCGTGTLAIAAKRQVGPTGAVHGIDASPAMIARATRKAQKTGLDVFFKTALAEALPFPDEHFDAVVSTLMLHHLPRNARQPWAREIRRVLKPRGRVLAVDFARTPRARHGVIGHFHRHGHIDLADIITVLSEAGLRSVESGPVGIKNLEFVLAAPFGCP